MKQNTNLEETDLRAILSVLGKDKPGIIANVSAVLYKFNINILDISQTVLRDEIFVMTMLCDLAGMNVSFEQLIKQLETTAKEINMEIKIQREELFESMHRV